MDFFYDWVEGWATVGAFLYFLTGFAFAYVFECVRAKIRHRRIKIQWQLAGIVIGVAALIISSIQGQIAYTTARDAALEGRRCVQELRGALDARAAVAAENDEVSQDQRRFLWDWIHGIIAPPPPYNTMDTNDPRRQTYGIGLTQDLDRELMESFARQDKLQAERDRHPIPDPTCGT